MRIGGALHAPGQRHPAGDRLAELVAVGELAALRGVPAEAWDPLVAARDLAVTEGRRPEWLVSGWLLGVALGAAGRYGEALDLLAPLAEAAPDPGAPAGEPAGPQDVDISVIAALCTATAASLHRQLGRHAAARSLDELGWRIAGPLGSVGLEARLDCGVGLAADAVGLGDAEEARRLLAAATAAVPAPGWRGRIRLAWVHAEVYLLEGQPGRAAELAAGALREAERARAPRHVAKSLLFHGVALATRGGTAGPGALDSLRRAAALAESLGALPLVWPAQAMLGALLSPQDRAEGGRHLQVATAAARSITGNLPAELQADWLSRPDIAGLLSGRPG